MRIVIIIVIIIIVIITIYTIVIVSLIRDFIHANNKKRQSHLRELAINVIDKLNTHNISYWVDYGTLLGIIRENDIILHDDDVDICIQNNYIHTDFTYDQYITETKDKLKSVMKDLDSKYYLEYHDWGAFRIREKNTRFFADIYLTKKINNMYVDPTGKIPIDYVGNKKIIQWNGINVFVPEKIHETLVWRYGDNYMTPIKNKKNENYTL